MLTFSRIALDNKSVNMYFHSAANRRNREGKERESQHGQFMYGVNVNRNSDLGGGHGAEGRERKELGAIYTYIYRGCIRAGRVICMSRETLAGPGVGRTSIHRARGEGDYLNLNVLHSTEYTINPHTMMFSIEEPTSPVCTR